MNIPASIVIEKMEEELAKLKKAISDDSQSNSYHEQATVIKAYCDILLSSSKTGVTPPPKVKHASAEDVEGKKSRSYGDELERLTAYDDDDTPNSDSLFDF